MQFIGFKVNDKQIKELEELETHLRRINPGIKSRSAAIKEALRITLHMINNDPIHNTPGLTEPSKPKNGPPHTRYITRISSDEIGIDGKRLKKT